MKDQSRADAVPINSVPSAQGLSEDLNEIRVFGPPGTGKTTYLARQVARAAEHHGAANVLVASFTKAAAVEIARRDLGLDEHDGRRVGTLHSLAYHAIGRPLVVFDKTPLAEWNERHPEWGLSGASQSLDDPDSDREGSRVGDEFLAEYDRLRSKRRDRQTWPESVLEFAGTWEAFKHEVGAIDFTDMIEIALRECPVAPGRPEVGFFDEVQDFSRLELDLVRSWARGMRRVVLAGDDDQAIYGFRGATPDAFLEPRIDARREIVLAESWRIPAAVHRLAGRWVSRLAYRREKAYRPRQAEGVVWPSSASYEHPDHLLDLIAETTGSAGTKRVLILAACGYHLRPTIKMLRREGVPFYNPWAPRRGDWNPLARRRGTSSVDRLLGFLRPDPAIFGEDATDLWPICEFQAWAEIVRADSVFTRGAKTDIARSDRVTLDNCRRWFRPEALGPALDLDLDWFESVVLTEKVKAMEFPLAVLRSRGARALRETPRVIVSTIHASKGGEADAVAIFPDLSPAGVREWNSRRRDRVVRQFYVGLTRAKETLAICRAATPNAVEIPL